MGGVRPPNAAGVAVSADWLRVFVGAAKVWGVTTVGRWGGGSSPVEAAAGTVSSALSAGALQRLAQSVAIRVTGGQTVRPVNGAKPERGVASEAGETLTPSTGNGASREGKQAAVQAEPVTLRDMPPERPDAPASPKDPDLLTGAPATASIDALPPVDRPSEDAPDASGSVTDSRFGRARRVPATPLGRMMGFGGLALGIAYNAAKASILGATAADKPSLQASLLSEENAERLARTLCRMRGAALKVGQMLSIQDERTLPPAVLRALERVRQSADFMPRRQLEAVLRRELGPDWQQQRVRDFEYQPVAAASIGQVHRARLPESSGGGSGWVAMKVQYPGVARSIESDLLNLKRLITYTHVLPRGLYVDELMRVAREELLRECDYELEAANQMRFAAAFRGFDHGHVNVPRVVRELSTRNVLTTEWVQGVPLDRVMQDGVPAAQRHALAARILRLTLKELFEVRFMQTDPNFSNFLYDAATDTLHLLDFGAAREYSPAFVRDYLRLVLACAERDRDAVLHYSQRLGFLTGDESRVMLDAHCAASFVVGEPFSQSPGQWYDFADSDIAARTARFGRVMLEHRLCPPPREAYSLHRRLSGAFLTCMRLQARVDCRPMLDEAVERLQREAGEETRETRGPEAVATSVAAAAETASAS
ncbi:hypothetical protein CDCA_CDCA11G3232 [Cyanidium caldarium]|uniref:ABC1 atypical kinase-like domain-containing protein n=1 Tax=Cyanidium caldarium TaxID=2771 RepID=A0AAV9IY39_CYACA|nr:hypothetical protein CDCA_CDCA11G3232 [Cyanidium caldarium]|eukprot:ctg_3046.g571